MKTFSSFLALSILGLAAVHADPFDKAQVTQTVQVVSLVDQQKGTQAAKIGDTVLGETAVKTGTDSRAELTFPDQTILRIGADAFFNFKAGGRSMSLGSGSMLFSSPHGAGGGEVQAGTVTAAVTGTNFLFSLLKNGAVKLVVLEGKVFLYFTANPTVRREFKAGESITIPKGDTVIGYPITINLKHFIATNQLLEASGFPPLPSEALLNHVADSQFTASIAAPSKKEVAAAAKAITAALPAGKTIAQATSSELSEAAGKVVAADSAAAAAVGAAIAGTLDPSPQGKEAIAAVIAKLAAVTTPNNFLVVVQAACAANPELAVTIAVAATKANPGLAIEIAYSAAMGAPGHALAIQDALTALFPDLADEIAAAVEKALSDISSAGLPGFTGELQQNPGVFTTPSPSPTSTPRPASLPNPSNTGGDVISGN
jgi:FecR protein